MHHARLCSALLRIPLHGPLPTAGQLINTSVCPQLCDDFKWTLHETLCFNVVDWQALWPEDRGAQAEESSVKPPYVFTLASSQNAHKFVGMWVAYLALWYCKIYTLTASLIKNTTQPLNSDLVTRLIGNHTNKHILVAVVTSVTMWLLTEIEDNPYIKLHIFSLRGHNVIAII